MTDATLHRMTLRELLAGATILESRGDLDVNVGSVIHDSRRVRPGDVFFAIDGAKVRGLTFAKKARDAGAAAIVGSALPEDDSGVAVAISDVRRVMGRAASAASGHPSRVVPTVGITGTNGKTTITFLLEAAWTAAGKRSGVVGTIDARVSGETSIHTGFTTPEAPDLQKLLADMVDAGAAALFLEVTSHAIALGRAHGTNFDVVAFTNLTQDHLDLHGSMEEYAATKIRLFNEELASSKNPVAVVNVDDPLGDRVIREATCPVITVSAIGREDADIRVVRHQLGIDGVRATIAFEGQTVDVTCPLMGHHNLSNLMVAFGITRALNLPLDAAVEGFASLERVPGRVEPVKDPRGSAVLVDYAHTPDALAHVTSAVAEFTKGRLIVLFGCGGDRDHTKRPLMGEAASKHADLVVATSDNPRTEEPMSIIDMALPGVQSSGLPRVELTELATARRGYAVEADRRKAIRAAVSAAGPDDVVLIAGKGHEDYQILGETKIHFDDREEAEEAIRMVVDRESSAFGAEPGE